MSGGGFISPRSFAEDLVEQIDRAAVGWRVGSLELTETQRWRLLLAAAELAGAISLDLDPPEPAT